MSLLKDIGIVQSEGKISKTFENLLPGKSFLDMGYTFPHEYVTKFWELYTNSEEGKKENASVNGGIFELIIYTLLYRENILPFYTQAKVAFVPNIEYDTILYSKSSPICLSLKTSLRERYKQADLEAVALKYVHRKAQSYLLTLCTKEAQQTKKKISDGDIIGLDDIIDCNTDEIDKLINKLKSISFCESYSIEVIEGNLVKKIVSTGPVTSSPSTSPKP